MSDFLTRMASLTRGEITAIKPRLPGHFAPVPDSSPAGPFEDAPLALGAYGKGPEPGHTRRQPAPEPEPAAAGKHASAQKAESSKSRQTVDTKIAAHEPGMIKVESGDEFIPGRAPAGMPLSPESAAEPANRQTLAGMEWAAPDFDYADNTEIPTESSQPGHEGVPVSPRQNDAVAQTPSFPVHPKLLVRTQPAGREDTTWPDLPHPPEAPQDTRNQPAVHISIGRIEVRASTSVPRPTPGPAPARQPGSLSLQDYLARGHTGGKRS